MAGDAKQRFTDLTVGEISVVDTPANEVEFLVMKRHEETNMSDTQTPEATAPAAANPTSAEAVPQPADESVSKAIGQLRGLIGDVMKAAGVAPNTEVSVDGEAVTTAPEDVEKGKGFDPRAMFEKQLKANGMSGDKLKAAMEKFDKSFKPFKPGPDTEPPLSKTKKNAEGESTEGADVEVATAEEADAVLKSLDALGHAVEKAKRFTPAREEAMKKALESLTKLLGEMTNVKPGHSPSTSTPGNTSFGASGVRGPLTGVSKALDTMTETFTKALDEVKETQKSLNDRLDTIEKSRTAPQSGGDDTTDGGDSTVKKSFWNGVL